VRNSNLTRWIFVSALLVALACMPVMAQAYRASLHITVVTEDGNPSVGATVILTGQAGARTLQTDSKGLARFASLEPGTYSAEVSQDGYNIAIHQGLRLATSASAAIEVVLQRSELVETIKVTSITPLMDRRKVGTSTVISPDEMAMMPTARDPWAVMNTVPGVQTDRINVGGSQSGQQSGFTGKGDNGDNATWVMDGVEFSDLAAEGGSSTYFDFNSFQEIGFTTAGSDLEQLSPGVRLTFVTKQGANRNTGSIGLILADADMQADQAEYINPDGSTVKGNKINETFEKNFELGGPIVKDKAWFWVGFNQNDIDLRIPGSAGELTDRTKLQNTTFKINGTIGGESNYKVFYTNGDKIKIGRNGGPSRPAATTWDQEGPTPIYTAEFSHFFNPNMEISGQVSHVGGGFQLMPQGVADQMRWDSDFVWQDTYVGYVTDRPTDQFTARGNWFVDGENTSHEFKFGFKYKTGEVESLSTYGTDSLIAVEWAGEAWLFRGGTATEDMSYTSIWAGDTILWNNWTFNVGALFMQQDGEQLASTGPGNGLCPSCLGDLVFNGADPGFDWSDVLPRLSAAYSFDTDMKQIVRFNYSEYADELHVSEVAFNHPMNPAEIDYAWNDLNSDGNVQVGEFDPNSPIWWGNVDPNNPNAIGQAIDRIDPNMSAPTVSEFILGYEIELAKDFTLGVNYTMRERDNTTWSPMFDTSGNVMDSGNWAAFTTDFGNIDCADSGGPCLLPGQGSQYSVTNYLLTGPGAVVADSNFGSLLTNRPDYSEDFESFEFIATKRLSNKWMLRGFVSFQDWTRNVGAGGIQNPANLAGGTTQDGSDVVVGGGTSSGAFGDVFMGTASWQYNINALYQLPHNFTVSANLNGREGYALPYYHQIQQAEVSTGRTLTQSLQVNNVSDYRLDDITMLDLKLGYLIQFSGDTTIDLSLEVFNALDDDTILQMERRMESPSVGGTAGRIDEVISPRIFRFGARVTF